MLEQKIEILTKAIEALTAALQENHPAAAPQPKIVEVSAPLIEVSAPLIEMREPALTAISEQDVKDLTLVKSRAGHKDAIRTKLDALNAKKITDLKADDAAAFYDWLVTL